MGYTNEALKWHSADPEYGFGKMLKLVQELRAGGDAIKTQFDGAVALLPTSHPSRAHFDTIMRAFENANGPMYQALAKMQVFTVTHEVYQKQVLGSVKEYQGETGEREQAIMAIKGAKKDVTHGKVWAKILTSAFSKHHEKVDELSKQQMLDIKAGLDQNPVSGGGSEKILQATSVMFSKLTTVYNAYTALEAMWRAVSDTMTSLTRVMDDATAEKIGRELLGDGDPIEEALKTMLQLRAEIEGYQTFVQANYPGLRRPDDSDDEIS